MELASELLTFPDIDRRFALIPAGNLPLVGRAAPSDLLITRAPRKHPNAPPAPTAHPTAPTAPSDLAERVSCPTACPTPRPPGDRWPSSQANVALRPPPARERAPRSGRAPQRRPRPVDHRHTARAFKGLTAAADGCRGPAEVGCGGGGRGRPVSRRVRSTEPARGGGVPADDRLRVARPAPAGAGAVPGALGPGRGRYRRRGAPRVRGGEHAFMRDVGARHDPVPTDLALTEAVSFFRGR
jgi:hypothetical protein